MLRTHDAGSLRASDIGEEVTLAGWVGDRRDHGGVAFIDLRDASGLAQVVIRDEILDSSGAHDLRNEFCIRVTGVVEARRVVRRMRVAVQVERDQGDRLAEPHVVGKHGA